VVPGAVEITTRVSVKLLPGWTLRLVVVKVMLLAGNVVITVLKTTEIDVRVSVGPVTVGPKADIVLAANVSVSTRVDAGRIV
jgi:hypothetical protein